MNRSIKTQQLPAGLRGRLTTLATSGAVALLAACSGGGQPALAPAGSVDHGDVDPRVNFPDASLYVAADGGMDAGTISHYPGFLQDAIDPFVINLGLAEGIASSSLNDNLFQAGITGGNATLRLSCGTDFGGGSFDADTDREITLGGVGAAAPKGIALADEAGFVFVADSGNASIDVYSQSAGSGATPVASMPTSGGNAWDVVYDAGTDRLFAALTNGNIDYYAGVVAGINGGGALGAPTRTFNATGAVNMHGIVYLPGDLLIASDVGSAADATDGAIYYFAGASNLAGAVTPARTIAGASTTLGNPVDLQVVGDVLLVAEKSNNAILTYSTSASGASGDVAPDVSVPFDAPESLLIKSPASAGTGTDANDFTVAMGETAATVLATGGTTVNFLEPDLSGTQQAAFTLQAGATVQNVNVDQAGNAYVTFDNAAGDGVLVVNRIADRGGETATVGVEDRTISSSGTAIGAPKGIEVVNAGRTIIVADFGTSTIFGFSLCNDGSVAPAFEVDVTDTTGFTASLWDVDYESGSDTLAVAGTNGQALIYNGFVAGATDPMAMGPLQATFVVTVNTTAMGLPLVNMHGIELAGNLLIASDVGSAAVNNDGRLVAVTLDLPDADDAGPVATTQVADFTIEGPNSMLGNPVDIAFDGTNLYVAEKANAQVLLFNDFLDLDPTPADDDNENRGQVTDATPDAMFGLAGAESVILLED